MSTFEHRIEVSGNERGPFAPLSAVVDTEATHTVIPRDVLQNLRVAPRGTRQFLSANGQTVDREISVVFVRLDAQVQPTVCVIGEVGSPPSLGAVTLEEFALAADPDNRRLVPFPHLYLL